MSVLGIDIGNENCYVAVARAGGIETIANEYSQRSTPTYVAFGEKTRDLGVSAKNKQVTNLKNTLFGFKRLIGRKYKDPVVQNELAYLPYDVCELPNGDIGIKVKYLQENTVFTVQQVMAMMLTKLKEISESNLQIKVQDCVISVPVYYTDVERRSILNAAEIAGLNVLKLMNETTSVALSYGFYRTDLQEDKPKTVVFVDLGNSILQVTACAFTKGKLKILGSVWDRNMGGRDFDNILVKYFVDDFKARYKLDVMSNRRAVIRLMQECEKLKKQMSANSLELPLNIECFMNDKDVSGRMKREVFESLASDLLLNIENTMKKLLHDLHLKPDDIESVQIVGGSSRLPAVKQLIQRTFGREPSTTLNQDEAVARGCALQCAMLSPNFKVRDFSMTDIQPYPIKLVWNASKSEDSEMEVFPRFHAVPFSRMLTYYRTEPFTLEAYYSGLDTSVGAKKLGSFTIQNVTPNSEGESTKVKVKARVNKHGIFSISSATMLEKQLKTGEQDSSSPQKVPRSPEKGKGGQAEEAMEADSEKASPTNGEINNVEANEENNSEKDGEKKEPDQKKAKSVLKSIELPIHAVVPHLSSTELNDLIETESKMIMQDKMEKEKVDAKNAVEEYVYEMRGKLSDVLEKFISPADNQIFKNHLEDTENWLYDEGEDEQKSVYVQKLNDLKKLGNPVIMRQYEWENRNVSLTEFGRSLQMVRKALESYEAQEEQYAHIEQQEMEKVSKMWAEKDKLMGQYFSSLSALKQYENPPVTVAQISQEKVNFENAVTPILNKPKPKVEPPADPTPTPAGGDNTEAPSGESEMPDVNSQSNNPSQSQPENMETN